jgi:hypothetical protein
MSTYGATSTLPPPPDAGGAVVVAGALVGALVVGAVVGAVVGGFVLGAVVVGAVVGALEPVQEMPLIVQVVGTPLPATMKPNTVVAPAGIVAL